MNFKDLIGELCNEDIKFLYWCWENKKYLNEMRLKLRPGKSINHLDTKGIIKSQKLITEKGGLDIIL